jgi:hypothetical protein
VTVAEPPEAGVTVWIPIGARPLSHPAGEEER